MSLPTYAVLFRGFWACPCQVEWIPAYEQHLRYLGILGPDEQIPIAQLIGGFPGSGGTHIGGGSSDFWLTGARAERAVWVARQMGADATWHRLAGWDGPGSDEHVHSVPRACPHLAQSAKDQISAVDGNGDGLGGTSTPDPGPRPLSFRTWREGVEWARLQEDDMADAATQKILADILDEAKATHNEVTALRGAEAERAQAARRRDEEVAAALDKLIASTSSAATKDQARKIKALIVAHDQEA